MQKVEPHNHTWEGNNEVLGLVSAQICKLRTDLKLKRKNLCYGLIIELKLISRLC